MDEQEQQAPRLDRAVVLAGAFATRFVEEMLDFFTGLDEANRERLAELAAFVRRHPDAPAEALFRQMGGVCLDWHTIAPVNGWEELQYERRLQFTLFKEVLLISDRAFAEEAKRNAPPAAPDPRRVRAGAGRKSMLRKHKGVTAKAVVTPPGVKPAPRPKAAPKPAGSKTKKKPADK